MGMRRNMDMRRRNMGCKGELSFWIFRSSMGISDFTRCISLGFRGHTLIGLASRNAHRAAACTDQIVLVDKSTGQCRD